MVNSKMQTIEYLIDYNLIYTTTKMIIKLDRNKENQ